MTIFRRIGVAARKQQEEAQTGYDGNLFRDQPIPNQQTAEEVAVTDEQNIHTAPPVMSMEEALDKYKNLDETNKRIVDLFIQTLVS